MKVFIIAPATLGLISAVNAFTVPTPQTSSLPSLSSSLFPQARSSQHLFAASTAATPNPDEFSSRRAKSVAQGGVFSFNTKYGPLNPFAIYHGTVAILLGLPWFIANVACQLLYKITGDRADKKRRLPTFLSHVWGTLLMRLTRTYPKIEGLEILEKFYKENRAAMFVGNHCSWMDIPFMGATIGWRNYKMVSKAELGKVPILGRSILCGGHVMLDRTSRRSQLATLKSGMQWLKDGVHLCTFPEGTRSKTGRLLPFKNGAFKMAHKQGSPVIPFSIVRAGEVHPANWMFACRPAHGICKVIVHEPVESTDKTEDELAQTVRNAIIEGLPEEQRPLN